MIAGACAAALFAAGCATSRAAPPDVPTSPNIVVILADDMGYSDIGSYGGEVPTPNLDRLAAEGTRFTQFYNSGRCVPTRASLLTGLYSHQVGLGHMTADFGHDSYRGALNRRGITLAEALKPAGYRSYAVGKWHLGSARGQWPLDRGFDRFYGLPEGGGVYFWPPFRERNVVLDSTVVEPQAGWYSTDAFNDYAVRFIREAHRTGAPFFLYLAHIAPHFPMQAPAEDIARHRGRYLQGWDAVRRARYQRLLEQGVADSSWKLSPRAPGAPAWESVADKDEWDLKMAVYAAIVERMDRGIGDLLATLDSLGISDETLVIFLSDNGASAEHLDEGDPSAPPGSPRSFTTYDLPWANVSNTPFRGFKSSVHQGGIATPMIARWPGVIPRGRIDRESVGHVIDLMPTLLEVAGATYPARHLGAELAPLPGRSLLPPLLRRASTGPRLLFWEHEGNRAVRSGDWKLVASHREPWQLYDLRSDPTELRDLAAAQPARAAQMEALYLEWAESAGALPWDEVQQIRRGYQIERGR